MREVFEYKKRYAYPHMSVADTQIWERFIEKYPDQFAQVQYDFHIGEAPPFNTLYDDDTDKNQDMLYRKRIDVVGHTQDKVFIIELKPNAGMSTIGQVKGYKFLYDDEGWTDKKTVPMIVTDAMSADTQRYCEREGVIYQIV